MIHRLRPAESSDFDALWELHVDCERRYAEQGAGGWNAAQERARFTSWFASAPMEIVEVDGDFAGVIAVRWDEHPVVVERLQLTSAARGRGLGTRLLHDVLRRAQGLELPVGASVREGEPARALLDRLGMKVVEHEDGRVRYRWEASIRTGVTLEAAMSPWADPRRRRAWAHRLFEPEPTEAVAWARFVVGRHGLGPQLDVLDLDVGPGRRLGAMASLGWRVTSCPLEAEDVARVKREAAIAGPGMTVVEGGLEGLGATASHDVVLALDGVLWTPLEHGARVAMATRIRGALRPGGIALLEGPNVPWELSAGHEPSPRTEVYHRASVSLIPARTVDFHEGVVEDRDTYVAEVDEADPVEWVQSRRCAMMGLPLLRVALEQAGLGEIEVYRDLGATGPARANGPRVVVSARATTRSS